MTKQSKPSSDKFICKYCDKEFRRENTLAVHLCETKRRWKNKDDIGCRIGIQAYQRFYKSTQPQSTKEKTHEDFIKSPYYAAFVKFGWYCHQIRAVNPMALVDYLLDNNVKLDWWNKDRYYEKYIIIHMQKEPAEDAITRTINELGRWADEHGTSFDQFFKVATPNKIVSLISNGRLSPWFLFNCDQGVTAIANFNEEQLSIAFKWVSPATWAERFKKHPEDIKWIREVLGEAGFND